MGPNSESCVIVSVSAHGLEINAVSPRDLARAPGIVGSWLLLQPHGCRFVILATKKKKTFVLENYIKKYTHKKRGVKSCEFKKSSNLEVFGNFLFHNKQINSLDQ